MQSGRRVLEVALVRYKKSGKMSLPGDFVTPGESIPAFLQDEIVSALKNLRHVCYQYAINCCTFVTVGPAAP